MNVASGEAMQPSITGRHLLSADQADYAAQIEQNMAAGAIDRPLETLKEDNRTSLLALILMTALEVIETYPLLPQLLTVLSTMICFCNWVESM